MIESQRDEELPPKSRTPGVGRAHPGCGQKRASSLLHAQSGDTALLALVTVLRRCVL